MQNKERTLNKLTTMCKTTKSFLDITKIDNVQSMYIDYLEPKFGCILIRYEALDAWPMHTEILGITLLFFRVDDIPEHCISLRLTFPIPCIFWNVYDSSTFCQNIRACLKSCSEMSGPNLDPQ
jgi:hypothetical protein